MEFKRLSKSVQWEARRIMASFGLKESELVNIEVDPYTEDTEEEDTIHFVAKSGSMTVEWSVIPEWKRYSVAVSYEGQEEWSSFYSHPSPSKSEGSFHSGSVEPMAKALYCLGVTSPHIIAKMNYPLSMHEQLELRLSMPREFWLQKWLDEESA